MKGVLLVNLGSPDSPEKKDVKKYLSQFLMDERVIDEPLWLRTLLVKGIILNTRPKKSAKAYKKIWWDEGSPLIVLSYRLLKKVDEMTSIPISLAMRYGKPSIDFGIKELVEKGVDEILLMDQLAKKMRTKRIKEGAITFDRVEVKFRLDQANNPSGVYFKQAKDYWLDLDEILPRRDQM